MRATPGVLLALVLTLPTLVGTAGHVDFHPALLVLERETPIAIGLRIAADETGDFTLWATACGPSAGRTAGWGLLFVDPGKKNRAGIVGPDPTYPNRQFVELEGYQILQRGQATREDTCYGSWGIGVQGGVPHARHWAVVWAVGYETPARFALDAGPRTRVAWTEATTAWAFETADWRDAERQVQVQQGWQQAVVIENATLRVDASRGLYGYWDAPDGSYACVVLCAGPGPAMNLCRVDRATSGLPCLTSLSWDGPDPLGGKKGAWFPGYPAGSYALTVERHVDASSHLGLSVPVGPLYASVRSAPNGIVATLADVALPS